MNVYQKPPADVYCPDWRKAMAKACPTCAMWTQINGRTATGEDVHAGWVCAKAAVFQGMLENANQIRELGAAVESLRNESIKRMDVQIALAAPSREAIPRSTVTLLEAAKR